MLEEVFKGSAASFPEQIVDIPFHSGGRRGFLLRQSSTAPSPQTADIPSSGGLQGFLPEQPSTARFVEQNVDIPVPRGRRGGGGGLQDFRPQQSSTAPASQIGDIPTSGGPHGFLSRQGSAASAAENVEFPAGGGLHGSRPGQGSTAFSGPEHGHDAAQRSRRGGGSVGGPQGFVPGQSSSARGRARHRRFVGRLFILPDSRGCGFIESRVEAEFGRAAFGGFRVPVSWQGHFAVDSTVTFSVRTGPDGFMEAYDIEAVGRE